MNGSAFLLGLGFFGWCFFLPAMLALYIRHQWLIRRDMLDELTEAKDQLSILRSRLGIAYGDYSEFPDINRGSAQRAAERREGKFAAAAWYVRPSETALPGCPACYRYWRLTDIRETFSCRLVREEEGVARSPVALHDAALLGCLQARRLIAAVLAPPSRSAP